MKDHTIVMGYAFLGKYVVNGLKNIGADFVVVAREGANVGPLKSEGTPVIIAPVTHVTESLKEAGIEHASALISTFEDDGDNMLAVMAAKKINPHIRVISIVNDKELVEAAKGVGADMVIPVQELMGQVLALSSISKEVAGVFLTDNLRSRHVAEFEVKSSSGLKYGQLNKVAPIQMVSRGGKVLVDLIDSFELMKGDLIYVLTDHESLAAFRNALIASSPK